MFVIQKAAMSLDGFIDDASRKRLILSNPADFDRVDEVRASCDAILVGANTIRKDNPRLLIRSEERQRARVMAGRSSHPVKITLSRSGDLDPDCKFFTAGETKKLVYCSCDGPKLSSRLKGRAEVIQVSDKDITPIDILKDLERRGISRLLIEGGSAVIAMFLKANLVDELQLSIAPFFVADQTAPRYFRDSLASFSPPNRMKLRSVEHVGDMAVLVYRLGAE